MRDSYYEETYQAGLRALQQADFETAIECFSEVVVDHPEHSQAWLHIGICFLEQRELESAIEAFDRATAADSQNADAHYLLGTAVASNGDIDRAAECYQQALRLNPHHVKAAEFLRHTQSLIESREHYRRGLQWLHGTDASEPDMNEAIRELLHSVALFNSSPARHDLIRCAQQIADSQAYVSRPIDVTPENRFWVHACRTGWHCLKAKNWLGAAQAYQDSLNYREEEAFIHHTIGLVSFQTGDPEDAIRAWLRVLQLDPEVDFTKIVQLEPR